MPVCHECGGCLSADVLTFTRDDVLLRHRMRLQSLVPQRQLALIDHATTCTSSASRTAGPSALTHPIGRRGGAGVAGCRGSAGFAVRAGQGGDPSEGLPPKRAQRSARWR